MGTHDAWIHVEDYNPPPYADEFIDFMNKAVTIYHAVDYFTQLLLASGFTELSELGEWPIERGGKYFFTRNQSCLVAFVVGERFEPGRSGMAFIGGHIDQLTMRVKPVSDVSKDGFTRLAAAPYAGAGAGTWLDRDLGLAGRALVRQADGSVRQKLVRLDHAIGRIPTLAVHFGSASQGPFNKETQLVPVIGLEQADDAAAALDDKTLLEKRHSAKVLAAVARNVGCGVKDLVDFDLDLYVYDKADYVGLDREFIASARCDDKLCSYCAIIALIEATKDPAFVASSGIVSCTGVFDHEEVGSLTRTGARSSVVKATLERIVEALAPSPSSSLLQRSFARSFFLSADVTHALNPNFSGNYDMSMAPMPNVGPVISVDANMHMTTDAASKAICEMIAERCGSTLQLFMIRNGEPSGGTIGPMLSASTGMRAAEIGMPLMSMHSAREMLGSKDPGLGIQYFAGFFKYFEQVGKKVIIDDLELRRLSLDSRK